MYVVKVQKFTVLTKYLLRNRNYYTDGRTIFYHFFDIIYILVRNTNLHKYLQRWCKNALELSPPSTILSFILILPNKNLPSTLSLRNGFKSSKLQLFLIKQFRASISPSFHSSFEKFPFTSGWTRFTDMILRNQRRYYN